MKRLRNTCSLVHSAAVLLALACAPQSGQRAEQGSAGQSELRFDPLGMAQDSVIITEPDSPAESRLRQKIQNQSAKRTAIADTSAVADSLNHQVYRVQLVTLESFSEARRAQGVAEEIFDLPVALNYDLPYYKLRVGEFVTKAEADAYLQKAKAAGYVNSWVVLANVGVKELKPLYEKAASPAASDTANDANGLHE